MITYLEKLVEDRMSELGIPEQIRFVDDQWKWFKKGDLVLYVKDAPSNLHEFHNYFYKDKTVFFFDMKSGHRLTDDNVPF